MGIAGGFGVWRAESRARFSGEKEGAPATDAEGERYGFGSIQTMEPSPVPRPGSAPSLMTA
jgi:hypothetical protein